MPTVSRLSLTPVKSTSLLHPDEVLLGPEGVAENRRFYFINQQGRLFNASRHGPLLALKTSYDAVTERLAIRFPDGTNVDDVAPADGRPITTIFWGKPVNGFVIDGPWSEAVSSYVGQPLRLVRAARPGGGVDSYAVSLVSTESLEELARQSGRDEVDARRFRMLIEVEGLERPHQEEEWVGRRVRVGDAVIEVIRPDPRCVITTMDPDTGTSDFDTLKQISSYRGIRDRKKIDFGVYADVVEPGRVRVGDSLGLLEAA